MRRAASSMGWLMFVIGLLSAFAAMAPFTPAVGMVLILLPLSTLIALLGARLPAGMTGLTCALALWASPMLMKDVVAIWKNIPWLIIWVVTWALLLTWAVLRRSRRYG